MKITTILFDFDLTLADSSYGVFDCANYALVRLGFPSQSYEMVSRTIGLSLSETFYTLSGVRDEKQAPLFRRLFVERADQVMVEKTEIYSFVPPTLKKLRKMGFALGIVSTKYRYRIEDTLRKDHLENAFDLIIGGDDVNQVKPDPEGLNLAIRRLSTKPESCLYVGDSFVDGEVSNSAGVGFIGVCTGTHSEGDFQSYHPLAVFDSVEPLPGLLTYKNAQ